MIQRFSSDDRPDLGKQRQLRIGELLRHELCDIFLRDNLRDPRLAGSSITISEVRVSPDLRYATAYVSLFGKGNMETVLKGLKRAAPYLGRRVASAVKLRNSPKFDFVADASVEQAVRIDALLRRPAVTRDLSGRKGPGKIYVPGE